MLYDKACERHCQVITQTFFAYLQRKSLAVVLPLPFRQTEFLEVNTGERIPRIQNPEKELVPFVTVLAQKSTEVLH